MSDHATPPAAPTEPFERTIHGTTTTDPWAWLADTADPRVEAHLIAENAYTEVVTESLAELRMTLFDEIKSRVLETDLSVPWRKGDWWYQARTFEGSAYPVHVRISGSDQATPPADDANADTILDENVIAEGHGYSQVGGAAISPDGNLLAWSVDHDGDEAYTVHFRDLSTGVDSEETVPNVSYPLAWSADSRFLFYTTLDAAQRPWRVWRHELGTAPSADAIVYEEPDERYFVGVAASRSGDWIVVSSQSAITSEHHLLDAHAAEGPLMVVAPRVQGVEYHVEPHVDRLFILSNADGAVDFALFEAPIGDTIGTWQSVIAHESGVRLDGADAFAGHLVVHLRREGVTGLRVIDLESDARRDVTFPEAAGTVGASANEEFDTAIFRYTYQSLVTPPSVFDEDLTTGVRTLLKQAPVLGGYDPADYTSSRRWATAGDGTQVPITLVHRNGLALDGTAPAVLYGYGAYEISMDPWFSAARLSLLERGWVFAIAHVRGGGEMGRNWYTDGKFENKPNSFSDFVACARDLIDHGYTAANRLVARGGSAGGLLMGAAANLAPELFAAVIAEVPFVDPLNTLLDPSLPLTVTEWEEWGNPVDDPAAFACIRSYAPYENVQAADYPAILATAGLNDPRVGVHEPAKWVQQLRSVTTGEAPILLRVEMGAGHGGPSGRYDAWRDEAFLLAFALTHVAT